MEHDDYGYVVERVERQYDGSAVYWRNGKGWMPLRYATLFKKKNDAVRRCVDMGSGGCTVIMVRLTMLDSVYPPSRATQKGER